MVPQYFFQIFFKFYKISFLSFLKYAGIQNHVDLIVSKRLGLQTLRHLEEKPAFFSITYNGDSALSLLQDLTIWAQQILKQNLKVVPLLDIRDPSRFVEKTSVERKLLSSLLYELAKRFAASNISGSINISRKPVFDAFWGFFLNFHPFEQHLCDFKGKCINFKLMCNNIFSTAVSYSYHRMKAASK